MWRPRMRVLWLRRVCGPSLVVLPLIRWARRLRVYARAVRFSRNQEPLSCLLCAEVQDAKRSDRPRHEPPPEGLLRGNVGAVYCPWARTRLQLHALEALDVYLSEVQEPLLLECGDDVNPADGIVPVVGADPDRTRTESSSH